MVEFRATFLCRLPAILASNAEVEELPMITRLIFTFPSAVTFTNAAVTAGVGVRARAGSAGSGTNTVTVNLTGVVNAQRVEITLRSANNGTTSGDVGVQMGMLLGDTSGNASVNASDVSQTKARSGQAVDATNFRSDVTVNGSINASDVSLVKSRSQARRCRSRHAIGASVDAKRACEVAAIAQLPQGSVDATDP